MQMLAVRGRVSHSKSTPAKNRVEGPEPAGAYQVMGGDKVITAPVPALVPSTTKARRKWPLASRFERPGVRSVLVAVVLLPTVATLALAGSAASARWSNREGAQAVVADTKQMDAVVRARDLLNQERIPAEAIAKGRELGLSPSAVSSFLNVDIAGWLENVEPQVKANPVLVSTPTLRADLAELEAITPGFLTTDSFGLVDATFEKICNDVEALWLSDLAHLKKQVSGWAPPGTLGVQIDTMEQTFEGFYAAMNEVAGADYVLSQPATPAQRLQMVSGNAQFTMASSEFLPDLGPKAASVWRQMQSSSQIQAFSSTLQEALAVAVVGGNPPLLTNLKEYGITFQAGLVYLSDMDNLVLAASEDLISAASRLSSSATTAFVAESVFVVLLSLLSIGGAVVVGRRMARPLKRLAGAAHQVREGVFDLPPLREEGPREVATMAVAFNEMTATLKGVEAKTIALAAGDMEAPELRTPLPGRTGRALQSAVDWLTARTRERERHRMMLEDQATHDALTGLLNRSAGMDMLSHRLTAAQQPGATMAVLFVDLDGLKTINDTFGHDVGDAAIKATADALREATREGDIVARLGGDEFLVLLQVKDSLEAARVAERIRRTVASQSIDTGQGRIAPWCSVGIAMADEVESGDPADLVRQADLAMYEARRETRSRALHRPSTNRPSPGVVSMTPPAPRPPIGTQPGSVPGPRVTVNQPAATAVPSIPGAPPAPPGTAARMPPPPPQRTPSNPGPATSNLSNGVSNGAPNGAHNGLGDTQSAVATNAVQRWATPATSDGNATDAIAGNSQLSDPAAAGMPADWLTHPRTA